MKSLRVELSDDLTMHVSNAGAHLVNHYTDRSIMLSDSEAKMLYLALGMHFAAQREGELP